MRRSSEQGLQFAFDRFSVACDQEGTKFKIEVLCLAKGSVSRENVQGADSCK